MENRAGNRLADQPQGVFKGILPQSRIVSYLIGIVGSYNLHQKTGPVQTKACLIPIQNLQPFKRLVNQPSLPQRLSASKIATLPFAYSRPIGTAIRIGLGQRFASIGTANRCPNPMRICNKIQNCQSHKQLNNFFHKFSLFRD